MYRCETCGAEFEEPIQDKQAHPYGMGYAYEHFNACPRCKDSNMIELHQCEECGDWFEKSELEDGICDECWAEKYGDEDEQE